MKMNLIIGEGGFSKINFVFQTKCKPLTKYSERIHSKDDGKFEEILS